MAPIFCVCLVQKRTLNTMYLDRTSHGFLYRGIPLRFKWHMKGTKQILAPGKIILKCILKLSPAYIVFLDTFKDDLQQDCHMQIMLIK